MTFEHWKRRLQQEAMPAYQLIPELIADDLRQGRLAPRDRLPTMRALAQVLALDYTTVTRGFALARERGLVASRPGLGTFTRGSFIGLPLRDGTGAEMTMNQPPEMDRHPAMAALQDAAARVMTEARLPDLMRYQDFGGSPQDRSVGATWLKQWLHDVPAERVLVAPGIHAALVALVLQLVRPGSSLAVERVTYPGIKAIAAQLGVALQPLDADDRGLLPEAFEDACRTTPIGALYVCPNLQNPTTATLPIRRREQIADIAHRYSIPLIEDDAYGMLPPAVPPSLAELAPGLTYYVSGLSKWLGAGLRTAYLVSPNAAAHHRVAGALRATTVMSSPVTNAIVTRWLESGLAAQMLAALRDECAARSVLAREHLGHLGIRMPAQSFHAWLPLPGAQPVDSDIAGRLQALGVPAVAAKAFCTDRDPPSALRLCLGGALTRGDCVRALQEMARVLAGECRV
jgi:DNA-binding transcriptional MocR family regulator